MSRITIELAKAHTRTDDIWDDEYLEHCVQAAESQVYARIGFDADELSGIPDDKFPVDIVHAILMRAASLYEYREDLDTASIRPLAESLVAMIKPYQRMRGGGLMERLVSKYPPSN